MSTPGGTFRAGSTRALVGALALVALLFCCAEALGRPFVPPKGKMYHGVSDTGNNEDFRDFQHQVGSHAAVLQEFFHWDVSYTASGAVSRWETTDALGMVAVSTKFPASGKPQIATKYIARGNADRYLLRINEVLGNLEQPTYIRLMPEMNGHWNPYSAFNADGSRKGKNHSTGQFKRAWRRFVIIVRGGSRKGINKRLARQNLRRIYRARSNNDPIYERKDVPKQLDRPKVAFMWVPQTSGSPNVQGNQPQNYWPGGNFVDWVGVDIFSAFESAAFPAMKRFYKRWKGRPFVIGEYSPWDADPGGAFTDRLLTWAERKPRVRMLMYYRSVSSESIYYIDNYPAAREKLRRHLNKSVWRQWAPGTRD